MKVIAIQNAPDIDTSSWGKQFNIERAYQKGDIFEIHKKYKNGLVIFNHHILGKTI